MKSVQYISISLLALTLLVFTNSCKKDGVCKGIITVVDSLNRPVFNAVVNLNSSSNTPPGIVKDEKKTDNAGKTYHEFPLEVILSVEASKGILKAPKNNLHFVPNETVNLTVKLKNQ